MLELLNVGQPQLSWVQSEMFEFDFFNDLQIFCEGFSKKENPELIIFKKDGAKIGCALVYKTTAKQPQPFAGRSRCIALFEILAPLRGQGYGTECAHLLEQHYGGILCLIPMSDDAERFWKSCGYKRAKDPEFMVKKV